MATTMPLMAVSVGLGEVPFSMGNMPTLNVFPIANSFGFLV